MEGFGELIMKQSKENYSKEHLKYLKKIKNKKTIVLSSQVGLLILFLLLWELLAQIGAINSFITSSPSKIVNTIGELWASGDLLKHMGVTLLETIAGFFIASILGTLIAILLWWSEMLRKILEPYIIILNSLPKIALGPLIIIWVGSGTNAIIAICVLICIIITIITMLNSFLSCDEDKILLMKSMGANKFTILTKLVLPYSVPNFISMLKINVGMSWVGSIMGEYLSSSAGLGYLIVYGSQVFRLDLVMTSTVLLCILAGLMYFAVALLEKYYNKKHR